MPEHIRVGIVGANPTGSWAAATHLPALAQLDEFEITAVATRNPTTAAAAAAATSARYALTAEELVGHDDVDLVVVAIKSPGHAEVVRAALAAEKHVLCEWPLGANSTETAELTAAAVAAGVVNAVVLQGYHSPSVNFVRSLLADGRIGHVQSISLVVSGAPLGGSRIRQNLAWSTDPAKGTGMLTIMAGHTLGVLEHLAGPLTDVSALLADPRETVTIAETGARIANGLPGQLALATRLTGGAIASVAIHGGAADVPDAFFLRITGTEATLTITPVQHGMYLHWADWNIRLQRHDGSVSELTVPDSFGSIPATLPAGPIAHIAALYRDLAAAITDSRPARPDFATGLRHRQLLDVIEHASKTGVRQSIPAR